jgi:hypothetical protein
MFQKLFLVKIKYGNPENKLKLAIPRLGGLEMRKQLQLEEQRSKCFETFSFPKIELQKIILICAMPYKCRC